jgi:DNA-binding LytR/AlgR family response regulator
VVIVTGYAEIGETKDLDAMLLLKKPYRLDDLAATIESALDSRQLLAVAASG